VGLYLWAQSLKAMLHFVNRSVCSSSIYCLFLVQVACVTVEGKKDEIACIVVNLPLKLCILQARNYLSQYEED
jgi:hypothetical protein